MRFAMFVHHQLIPNQCSENCLLSAETGSLNLWRGAFIASLGPPEAKNLTSVNKISMLIVQVVT